MPEKDPPPAPSTPPPLAGRGLEQLKRIYTGRTRAFENLREGLQSFFASNARFYTAFLLFLVAMAAVVLIPQGRITSEALREGEIAHRNIYAPADLLAEDTITTAKLRQAAAERVRDQYEVDVDVSRNTVDNIKGAFGMLQQGYLKNEPRAYQYVMREMDEREFMEFGLLPRVSPEYRLAYHEALRRYENSHGFMENEKLFWEMLGLEPDNTVIEVLRAYHYREPIADWISQALVEAMQSGIVADSSQLPESSRKKGIALVNRGSGEVANLLDFQDVMDTGEARAFVRARLGETLASHPLSLQRTVIAVAEKLVRPNIAFNRARTMDVKKAARDSVEPVFYQIKKGELVAREGEKLSAEQIAKIEKMRSGTRFGDRFQTAAGAAVFILLAVAGAAAYVRSHMGEFTASRANVALLGLLFLGQAALLRVFMEGAEVFAVHNPAVSLNSFLYAAPFAAAPLLAAIFFPREAAVLVTLLTALTAGILFKPTHHYILFAFAGGMVSVFHSGRIMRRSEVWRVGMRILGANFVVVFMMQSLEGQLFMRESVHDLLFSALGSLFTVTVTLALTPLIESWFPVVSDIRLLELQDLNHPLLAKMAVVASGTYHHSIIVGNLAEDAAEAIGANPLLARVGSYFHDIGKIYKPEYFIENQRDGVNKHDSISPTMSALILTSHVTRGLEMAREYKLIPQIHDIIAEHHGMQVMHYFFHRAKEMEKEGNEVSEQNFRYPGRRPHTRESAIVALADSVEAASRALKSPTSSRLRQLVSKIINDKFVSGQLDDSHLTLHDINKIGDSFVRVLHGIFHYRVEYPGERSEDEDPDNLKTGGPRAEYQPDKEKAPADLKRAG